MLSQHDIDTAKPPRKRVTDRELRDAVLAYSGSEQRNPRDENEWVCQYDDGKGGHCIAGQIITDLGGRTNELQEENGSLFLDPSDEYCDDIADMTGLLFSRRGIALLSRLQTEADNGSNHQPSKQPNEWGLAIAEVNAQVEGLVEWA